MIRFQPVLESWSLAFLEGTKAGASKKVYREPEPLDEFRGSRSRLKPLKTAPRSRASLEGATEPGHF